MRTLPAAGFCRQVHEASSLGEEHGGSQHSQSIRARPGHVREGPVEIGGTSRLNELRPHPQRPRRDFCRLQHVLFRAFGDATWLPEDSDPTDPRNGLLEQLQTLADELRSEDGQPRDIAARPRKAGDEPVRNRIGDSSEDNGDGPGRLLGGQGGGCAWATMTSTFSATSSAARAGNRSGFPSASRYSITTLRPST